MRHSLWCGVVITLPTQAVIHLLQDRRLASAYQCFLPSLTLFFSSLFFFSSLTSYPFVWRAAPGNVCSLCADEASRPQGLFTNHLSMLAARLCLTNPSFNPNIRRQDRSGQAPTSIIMFSSLTVICSLSPPYATCFILSRASIINSGYGLFRQIWDAITKIFLGVNNASHIP